MKQNKTIEAYRVEDPEIPEDVEGFMSFWADKIALIPEEYRSGAAIELKDTSRWGDFYFCVLVTYTRPETEAEQKEREKQDLLKYRHQNAKDRAEYERLKEVLGL